ncbi:MAG: hypothetical protein D6772_12355 [Bacteroidetes bacterium]|nr:MAG: hypothetical protein D6772_12355 [Bacteroidota bacterium]
MRRQAVDPAKPVEVPPYVRLLLWSLLSGALAVFGQRIIQAQPLDYTFADMLPIIQIMGERWLLGEEVYAVIPEIWDGMQPIYLPMLWLSYVPALLLEVDIRWTNVVAMIIVSALVLDVFSRRSWRPVQLAVLLPLLILLSYIFIVYSTFLSISEEPIVLLAYMLLGYGLWKKRAGLLVFALAACPLSRYALVFWAICWWGYQWWQGDRKHAWVIAVGSAGLAVLALWMSQGLGQLELFYSLKDAFLDSFTPQLAWRTQNTVNNNLGLARFVPFAWLPGPHRLLFWGSLVLPVLIYIWYHLRLRMRISAPLFALCSLKLCLVFFFNFNPLPYSYLFCTSTFLSLLVFGLVMEKQYTSEGVERRS